MNNKTVTPSQQQRNRSIKRRVLKAKRKRFGRFFTIFLILYLTLMLIVSLYVFIAVRTKPRVNEKNLYTLEVLAEEETIKYSKEELYFNKDFYVPLSAIQKLCPLTLTGDGKTVGFMIRGSEEFAKFELNSENGWVNGNEIELSQKVLYIDGELYLPWDFFKTHLNGFVYQENDENKVYTLSRDTDPYFLLKKPASTENQSESDVTSTTKAPIDFVLDLSAYEEYMNPEDRDEFLFIVSPDHPLDETYVPSDLVGSIYTRDDGRATQKLKKYACLALEAFLKEAEANGCKNVTVTSGYRSYEYQSQLFQNEINITGSVEAASKNVNPPGSSEHQSGLCADMHNLSSASTAFAGTYEADWLAKNAHKFGYVLRYPKNKTEETGIGFEPWHFRYVGRYHATKMHELDMCLEEYMEYISK